MTISIVMATYNGEKYLTEQLDSLRLQTRPADEVIIQDDGSTDGTAQLVQDYIKKYDLADTWNFICNEYNLGYAENFKTATLKSKGDLIFFCDQDDIWHVDKLELVEKFFNEHGDMTLLVTNYHSFYSEDNLSGKTDNSKDVNDGTLHLLEFNQYNMYLRAPGCVMTFRRALLDKTKEVWFSGYAHDEYVWKSALCFGKVYHYHNCTIERRFHSQNTSMHKMRKLGERINYLENLLCSFEAMGKVTEDKFKLKLINKNIRAVQLRLGMVKDKKYFNFFPLLFKLSIYQAKKTLLLETYMSIRRKKFQ